MKLSITKNKLRENLSLCSLQSLLPAEFGRIHFTSDVNLHRNMFCRETN